MPDRMKCVVSVERKSAKKDCSMFLELLNLDLPVQEKLMKRLTYEANGAILAGLSRQVLHLAT